MPFGATAPAEYYLLDAGILLAFSKKLSQRLNGKEEKNVKTPK